MDAVQDLIDHPTFREDFSKLVKGMPDLERIVSRIHAKNCKVKDFLQVLNVRELLILILRRADKNCTSRLGSLRKASTRYQKLPIPSTPNKYLVSFVLPLILALTLNMSRTSSSGLKIVRDSWRFSRGIKLTFLQK